VSKEQILEKMREFEIEFQKMVVAMQAAHRLRSELRAMITSALECTAFADSEIPLLFNRSRFIIAWGDRRERFTPSTFRLLRQLWLAPDQFLSKQDVCIRVNKDPLTSDGAIRYVLCSARQEMKNCEFPYEIETVWGKGYKLKKTNVRNVLEIR